MHTVAEIDARIEVLVKELSSLRRRRNALTPLCRLPTELKVQIFQHVQYHRVTSPRDADVTKRLDNPLGDTFGQQRSDLDHSWMKLMSCCVSLRETALATGHLWRYIQLPGNPQWRDLCLERAKGCPPILRYVGPTEPPGRDNSLDFAAVQFIRAAEAYLTFKPIMDNKTKPDQMEQCIYSVSSELSFLEIASSTMTLTDRLMGGTSIKLTTLILTIDELESCPAFPNLINLKLEWSGESFVYDADTAVYITQVNRLIQWLGVTRKLQNLSLTWPEWFDLPAGASLRSDIPCPPLRTLSLYTPACLGTQLLNVLPLPSFGLDVWLEGLDGAGGNQVRESFGAARRFWASVCSQTADTTAPLSTVLYYDSPHAPILSLRSCPRLGRIDSTKPFCRLTAEDHKKVANLETVRALHLVGDCVGPTNRDRTDDIKQIDDLQVDLLIVEDANLELHINALGKWLRQRKSDGRPVALLQIRDPVTEKARGSLEKLAANLIKRKAIETVEWV
jgi:hypothetical protein